MPTLVQTITQARVSAEESFLAEQGLSSHEAKARLRQYGPNSLPSASTDGLFAIVVRQFRDPLIYVLLFASIIVFLTGEYIDGLVILFVLVFNAVVGTIQEGKAQNILAALKNYVTTSAIVIRDGKQMVIPDSELVPGDLCILQEGDKVPADVRLMSANNLRADESSLTGESMPVHKDATAVVSPEAQVSEQKNMLFKGTHVVAGNATVLVLATGVHTYIGKISKQIQVIDTEIPLKVNIRMLSKNIIVLVVIISISLFALGLALGNTFKDMFSVVVSLSVSIIPAGLPIVMTLVLAKGVWRMSRRNALVKRLQAVEALGQAQIIAVDKTGTITKNEIILQKVYIGGQFFEVTGEGYAPVGKVFQNNQEVSLADNKGLALAVKISRFASNNHVIFDEEQKVWRVAGDPTEAALSVFSQKLGYDSAGLKENHRCLQEIPFDYKNKYHAVARQFGAGVFLAVAGAPESLLALCDTYWKDGYKQKLTPNVLVEQEVILNQMSGEGLRVIAFAYREVRALEGLEVSGLTFGGFFGLKDPLRPEVHEAMAKAHAAGIKVVMITGDHKATAQAIAKEAGIFNEGDIILTGDELTSLNDERLSEVLDRVSAFARVTPDHKLRIIQAYRHQGKIIAMTGDGVNDAPSLVAADLGVAMGKIGTEVAKEASDIVLLDDNFGTIISAIEEGRSIYRTIKKVILYLFTTSLGEVLTITASLLLGLPLPILAAQILWLNLVTDGFLDVSLAMEPKEHGLLTHKELSKKAPLVDALMWRRMIIMAAPMMVGTLWLFSMYYQTDIVKAWTISLTTLAVFQWFNAWNCRHDNKSIFQINPLANKMLLGATGTVIILQLLAIYHPLMQKIFHTTSLNMADWLLILPVAMSVLVLEEGRKLWKRRVLLVAAQRV